MINLNQEIADAIETARQTAGKYGELLTIEDLAIKSGVSVVTVNRIRKGTGRKTYALVRDVWLALGLEHKELQRLLGLYRDCKQCKKSFSKKSAHSTLCTLCRVDRQKLYKRKPDAEELRFLGMGSRPQTLTN
jgi:transcriptional regulator with XRE-family HTH domain